MAHVKVMSHCDPFVIDLMKVLGLPQSTTAFEVRCAFEEIVTVKCWYHPDDGSAAGFDPKLLLTEYRLVEAGAAEKALVTRSAGNRPVVPQPQPLARGGDGGLVAAAIVVLVPLCLLVVLWLANWQSLM